MTREQRHEDLPYAAKDQYTKRVPSRHLHIDHSLLSPSLDAPSADSPRFGTSGPPRTDPASIEAESIVDNDEGSNCIMGAIYSLGIENDIHSVESDPMFPPSFSPLQQRIQALEAATRRRERKKTLAAIRCDNEAIAIASTVLRTWHHIDKALGIDDSSNDSPRIAKIDGATVITHEKNRGKAAGVSTALDCARDHGFDLLVLLDGNGQHDPDEVPGDLGPSPRRKGRSGDRLPLLQNGNGSVPTYRRLGQTIHILVTNSNSTAKITDFPSGFRGSLSSGDGELYDRLRRLLGGGWI